MHVKEGRAHIHCVWSRIDTARMCAIPGQPQLSDPRGDRTGPGAAIRTRSVQGAFHTIVREHRGRLGRTRTWELQQAARTGTDLEALERAGHRALEQCRHEQGLRGCPSREWPRPGSRKPPPVRDRRCVGCSPQFGATHRGAPMPRACAHAFRISTWLPCRVWRRHEPFVWSCNPRHHSGCR